jgi:tetratricopeptide (TPR) repeat protein
VQSTIRNSAFDPGDRPALLASLAIFAAFVVAMIALGIWGGPLVSQLSGEVGEVTAQRATDLAAAGEHEQAVRVYESALRKRFEDEPIQRIYAMLRLAKSHQALENDAASLGVLKDAFKLDPTYGPTYTMLFDALRKADDLQGALTITQAYSKAVEGSGNVQAQKWAKYNEGVILRDSGNASGALDAFTASHILKPSPESGYQCAQLLYQLNRTDEARDMLMDVIGGDNQQYAALARSLLEKIDQSKK